MVIPVDYEDHMMKKGLEAHQKGKEKALEIGTIATVEFSTITEVVAYMDAVSHALDYSVLGIAEKSSPYLHRHQIEHLVDRLNELLEDTGYHVELKEGEKP